MQNPEHSGKSWSSNIEILLCKLGEAWKAGVKGCTKDGFCGRSSRAHLICHFRDVTIC